MFIQYYNNYNIIRDRRSYLPVPRRSAFCVRCSDREYILYNSIFLCVQRPAFLKHIVPTQVSTPYLGIFDYREKITGRGRDLSLKQIM